MKVYLVTIPENVDVETGAMSDEGIMRTMPYSFVRHFISHTLLSDTDRFGQSEDDRMSAQEIRGLFQGKKPGAKVSVPERDWERGREVIKKPCRPYAAPQIMAQLGPFFAAWKDAEPREAEVTAKPREERNGAEAKT